MFTRICPSVILYLLSVCPAIWLIELKKLDKRLEEFNAREALKKSLEGTGDLGEIITTIASTTVAISTATTPLFESVENLSNNLTNAQNSTSDGFPVNNLMSGKVRRNHFIYLTFLRAKRLSVCELNSGKNILTFQIPDLKNIPIPVDEGMLVTLIEQCLMLFLIIGRWMLPSEMSRDELAQLLLCYIGVAADIIEFFDSFKVYKILQIKY